jgi:hypothetical protein
VFYHLRPFLGYMILFCSNVNGLVCMFHKVEFNVLPCVGLERRLKHCVVSGINATIGSYQTSSSPYCS